MTFAIRYRILELPQMIRKLLLLSLVVLTIVAGMTVRSHAQSYERVRATKLVLSSMNTGVPDLSNSITILAPLLIGTSTLTLPGGNVAGILTNDVEVSAT